LKNQFVLINSSNEYLNLHVSGLGTGFFRDSNSWPRNCSQRTIVRTCCSAELAGWKGLLGQAG